MRILYYNPHQGFDSGAPKVLVRFIEHLDRSTFEPLYLATGKGPLVDALASLSVEIVRGRVSKVGYRIPATSVRNVVAQAVALRNLRISLLHVFDYGWNLDLVLAAWILRIPLILHEHLGASADFQNLHRFAASKVLTCSRNVLEGFGHLHRIEHKCEVLYNPVDVSAFQSVNGIRESLALRRDQVVIGTVARTQYRKGIDVLLETARILIQQHKNLFFLVVGGPVPGQEKYAEQMIESAKDPAFDGRVKFLGSRQDIPEIMASLDLFVFPTRAEPFGVAIIEAMAAGLPVIASCVGGIPEIISSEDIGVLVSPISPESFAAAINRVLSMSDRGKAIGEKARRSVTERFDPARLTARLQEIYLGLVQRKHPD